MEKIVEKKKSIILLLGIIYTMLTILALVSTISTISSNSTIGFSFVGVLKIMWWPILIILGFALIYILYIKNEKVGAIVELMLGLAMLVNNLMNMIVYGTTSFAVIFSFIFPVFLISQAIMVLNFKRSEKTIKKKEHMKTMKRKENRSKAKSQ